ncbi:hypothetical protein [Kocuria sp. TGY1127_2]|nr:hypothetical protein [Kocuria sp. TGY1127_2]
MTTEHYLAIRHLRGTANRADDIGAWRDAADYRAAANALEALGGRDDTK